DFFTCATSQTVGYWHNGDVPRRALKFCLWWLRGNAAGGVRGPLLTHERHGRPLRSLTCGRVLFPERGYTFRIPGPDRLHREAHEATGFHWPARQHGSSLAPSRGVRAESVEATADRG